MKKNLIKIGLLLVSVTLLFASCQKAKSVEQLTAVAKKAAGLYAIIETENGSVLYKLNTEEQYVASQIFAGLACGQVENESREIGVPFFDGLKFYSVSENRLLRSGCPKNNNSGDSSIKHIPVAKNTTHNRAGLLSLAVAKNGRFDGRFILSLDSLDYLDSRAVVIGEAVSSFSVLKKLKQGNKVVAVKILQVNESCELVDFEFDQNIKKEFDDAVAAISKNIEKQFASDKAALSFVKNTLVQNSINDGLFALLETSRGFIFLKLFYKETPMTVANFVGLAEGTIKNSQKPLGVPFYDGLKFHRVIEDFMIQGGCPYGTGTGGPGYRFKDEFRATLRHSKAGVLSMANSGPATNGSQFFITHKDTPWLDDKHTVFGEVVKGQDVVNAIKQDDLIKSIKIVRLGADLIGYKPTIDDIEAKAE